MDRHARIAYAGNTLDHALAAIYDKGYKVFLYPDPYDEGKHSYWAIKDRRDLIACDPVTLLGLIGLWERFGDAWHRQQVPDYLDQLYARTYPDDDYKSLDEIGFDEMVQDLRLFFEAIGEPIPEPLSRDRLAEFMLNFSRAIEDRANRA